MTDSPEVVYLRAIEDAFVALRGTIFVVKPSDYALMRAWWHAGVPLGAVVAGLAEVFERVRMRDGDLPSKVAFCKRAVVRHARRLADAHVGGGDAVPMAVGPALQQLTAAVRECRLAWPEPPSVVEALDNLICALEGLPEGASPAALEATLEQIESAALAALLAALPALDRERLERVADEVAGGAGVTEKVAARSRRAVLARAVREHIGLPRLELESA